MGLEINYYIIYSIVYKIKSSWFPGWSYYFVIPGLGVCGHLATHLGNIHLHLVGGTGLAVNLLGGNVDAVLYAVLLPFCPWVGLDSLLQLTRIGLITLIFSGAAQPPLCSLGCYYGAGGVLKGLRGGEKMQESFTWRIKDAVEAVHDCSV